MSDTPANTPMRGLLWSHLLAAVCGGLALAGVLLAFGVIGKQRTVSVDYSTAPPANPGATGQTNDTEQIFNSNSPAVVFVKAAITERTSSPFAAGTETASSTSTGSGVLIASQSNTGYILTTYHQIKGSDFSSGITVEFNAQTLRRAKVISYHANVDLALLEVNMKGVPSLFNSPVQFGDSQDVNVGDTALALANPFGRARTLSSGLVSALQTELTATDGTSIPSVIQTDIPASPGTSGGPLLDVDGSMIGLDDQIELSNGGTSYLLSFAIPIDTIKPLLPPGLISG